MSKIEDSKINRFKSRLINVFLTMLQKDIICVAVSEDCFTLRFAVYRADRTDEKIDEEMRLCKVSIDLVYSEVFGEAKSVRVQYKIYDRKEDWDKMIHSISSLIPNV